MAFNEPEEIRDDFPTPEKRERRLPLGLILLAVGLIALIGLLAFSY